MSLDKISLTFYDFLGYLLPGYIVVLICSLFESTFLATRELSLSQISHNVFLFGVIAYVIGHAVHTLGPALKRRARRLFRDDFERLDPVLRDRITEALAKMAGVPLDHVKKLNTLQQYMLADSYVLASGGSGERDVLMAREGFYRGSMVAFGLLSGVLLAALFAGGLRLQIQPGIVTQVPWADTLSLAILSLVETWLFRRGAIFYNRVKNNMVFLLFLALWQRDHGKRGNEG